MKSQSAADLQQDYLDAIELTSRHVSPSSRDRAEELLSKFAAELGQRPEIEFAELRVIALLALCRIQEADQAKATRQEAISLADRIDPPGKKLNIEDHLADLLVDFGEFRRAIPFCEQAIKLSRGSSAKVAMRLWRAGRTYLRAGFKQHAEEPLRKALELFRHQNDGSFTPVILTDLGNALRTSNPTEAEKSYCEAAAIWENKGAPAQATTAWVNLGILCGEQGRLDESLQWYEKASQVRQADPSTPRAKLGSLANNIANLHRRMKNYDLAVQEVERAIALLDGDPVLADAYGTYGLILQEQGSHEKALEWFRKSRMEHARQSSPNLSALTEALGNEAATLSRLGRMAEAVELQEQIIILRGDCPPLEQHQITTVAKAAKPAAGTGEVLVELDGVHLPESVYKDCDLATLENRIEEALDDGEYGELDGHETGPENTTLFLYGPNAEALFHAIEPLLRDYPLCQGARVTIRQNGQERLILLR